MEEPLSTTIRLSLHRCWGDMHQNLRCHDATFHLRGAPPSLPASRLCPRPATLPLSGLSGLSVCLSVCSSSQAQSVCRFSSGEIVAPDCKLCFFVGLGTEALGPAGHADIRPEGSKRVEP